MSKTKKYSLALTALLIAVVTIGSIGTGILTSNISNELQASVLKEARAGAVKKKKTRRAAALLAQLVVPETVINPLTTCLYVPPQKPEYKGEFMSNETDVWASPKGDLEVSVYLKNTGDTTWFGDTSGCSETNYVRLGTAHDRDRASLFFNPGDPRWISPNRIAMVEPRVEPGEIATFTFRSKAPDVTDIFREYFQPLVEGKSWMESTEETVLVDVYVGETTAEHEKSLFYLGKSGQASALDLSGEPVIDVDISDQKLQVKFGETVVRDYTVSTGTFKTPTPLGRFEILNKQELRIGGASPHYRMPMWQGFTKWGHGFHALPYLANDRGVFWNEALNHIGQRVSHGCVRLLPGDAEDLYNLTQVGMAVVIHD